MQARYLIPVLALTYLFCVACGGSPTRRPALHPPVTPQQEYRQEAATNIPSSLFAASETDTLFEDSRARRVGDIVVVKLVENTKAQNKAETTANKNGSNDYQVSAMFNRDHAGFIPFVPIGPQPAVGLPVLNTGSVSGLTATGKTKRENYVTATMGARIVQVLPNGVMQVQGAREIKVNDETQYMVVTGLIRQRDIDSDNSVLSTQMADSRIDYYGKGVLADKQKSGWLTRLLDIIWPF